MCVRPILTMSAQALTFASNASRSVATAGTRRCFVFTAAAMYIAEGNVSFDDCAILT